MNAADAAALPRPVRGDLRLAEVTGQPECLEQIYRLRVEVWQTQAALPAELARWHESVDDMARHWAFFSGPAIVAAVRLSLHKSLSDLPDAEVFGGVLPTGLQGPLASFNRMVVHPEFRGIGLSAVLDDICISAATEMEATALVGSTGSVAGNRHRVETMLRRGFSSCGLGQPYANAVHMPDNRPTVLVLILRGAATTSMKIGGSTQ